MPSVLITYSTVSLSLLLSFLPACSDKVYMKLCHFRTTRCTQCPHMPSYQKQHFIKVFGLNLTFLFQIVCPYSSCGSPVSLKLDHHKSKCKVWVGTSVPFKALWRTIGSSPWKIGSTDFVTMCKKRCFFLVNQPTALSLINAPPLINAPLTYFQIKLGKMPKFLYGVS